VRILATLLLLAGCGAPPPLEFLRDPQVPIASTTRGGPADLVGSWHVVASFAVGPVRVGDRVYILVSGSDWEWALPDRIVQAKSTGLGRFEVAGPDFWVLWVDDSFRTAVIGTPGGEFGWVMNRNPQIPADRLRAAREILEFNGYDITRLR